MPVDGSSNRSRGPSQSNDATVRNSLQMITNTSHYLISELILDVLFYTPKHKRLENHMQATMLMPIKVIFTLVFVVTLNVFGEHLPKFFLRFNQRGKI